MERTGQRLVEQICHDHYLGKSILPLQLFTLYKLHPLTLSRVFDTSKLSVCSLYPLEQFTASLHLRGAGVTVHSEDKNTKKLGPQIQCLATSSSSALPFLKNGEH